MNAAAETRLLLAMARYLANDGEHAPSIFDVEDALKAVEATGENAKESGIRPPSSTGGAGGGDPLPQPTVFATINAAVDASLCSDAIRQRDQAQADLARLSLVHQQLKAECVRLVDEWRIWAEKRAKQAMDFEHAQRAQMLHESCLHVIRADELERALRLAASTTETPTP